MKTVSVLLAAAALCFGGDTQYWSQSDFGDFSKGVRTNLSIRSDGRLSLAPKMSEVYDSSTPYLWALARDSKGNLYTAGGPGAKVFRIAPGGKSEQVAQFDALEVHAIAIDGKDRIYAATSPDGKIYRIENGKSSLFYDPKQKYIWSMLCDPAGNLFIATGDQGELHKVTPDGKGEVFFRSDETHIRSIAFDREGNLIAGTEPGGLVIRISPKGEGFVLYQMSKPEVTALAVGAKNEIYAAAVGTKSALKPVLRAPAPAPAPPPPAPSSGSATITVTPQVAPAPAGSAQPIGPATVPGGSDVYVIPEKGAPSKLWTSAQDVVYTLALDPSGRVLIGAGNKGTLYRLEDHSLYQTLLSFPVEQITNLIAEKDGTIYAATGNVGKVFHVGPGLEREGSIESDVFDSGGFTRWGRIQAGGTLNGGSIALTARSGNLDRPQKNWSAWSQPVSGMEGGNAGVPAARFLQWKATIKAGAGEPSPWLDSVDAAYLRSNVAPKIEQVEITPDNYRFPSPSTQLTLSSAATLVLPAFGAKTPSVHSSGETNTYPGMTYQKGALGVRWTSSDENGDTLVYRVEIRGSNEKNWKPLRETLHDKYYSFDSTAFADGEYRLKITASDAPSNTPEDALSASEESDPFTIDNTPPEVTGLHAVPGGVLWHAADAMSTIYKAEYSIDGGDWTVVDPIGKLSDARSLDYRLEMKSVKPGEHTIAVRVSDENDNMAIAKIVTR